MTQSILKKKKPNPNLNNIPAYDTVMSVLLKYYLCVCVCVYHLVAKAAFLPFDYFKLSLN